MNQEASSSKENTGSPETIFSSNDSRLKIMEEGLKLEYIQNKREFGKHQLQNKLENFSHLSTIRKFQKNILLWTVILCALWLLGVFIIFVISLLRFDVDILLWTDKIIFNNVKFNPSDSVMITLLSTTTANVLGALWIVMHWLYPNRNNSEE